METLTRKLMGHALVSTARARDEKQFFGQGWSHYPKSFEASHGGARFYLSVFNTPNHTQFNWSVSDPGYKPGYSGQEAEGISFALTPEETRALAGELSLDLAEWLSGALEACRTDRTASQMERMGDVTDLANFHAGRIEGPKPRPGVGRPDEGRRAGKTTAYLAPENLDWVKAQAEERGLTQSDILNDLVKKARGGEE